MHSLLNNILLFSVTLLISSCNQNLNTDGRNEIVGGGSRMDPVYNYSWKINNDNLICRRHINMKQETTEEFIKRDYGDSEIINLAKIIDSKAYDTKPPFIPGFLPPYIDYRNGSRKYFIAYDDEKILDWLKKYTQSMKDFFGS